jgi:hypothetical protein
MSSEKSSHWQDVVLDGAYGVPHHYISEEVYGHLDDALMNELEPSFDEHEDPWEMHNDEEDNCNRTIMKYLCPKCYRKFSLEDIKNAIETIKGLRKRKHKTPKTPWMDGFEINKR